MYPLGAIPIAVAASWYIAWVWCRARARRGLPPTGWVVVVAGCVGVLFGLLGTFRTDVFHPTMWQRGKVDLWIQMLLAAVPSLLLGWIVAAMVAMLYDRRHTATLKP